ncbi:carbamoyltransferase HypF [Nitrospirillum sp. BR 11163]|uniref:carbamoyltransferase HypF n=1 Tax=Nitrospirillum sp. BR 11163 TaxID=3104323 RepID=UPI002AFE7EAB|nr:carbamoyltransferase HypF [Nitrospirillum sp. BR 11163]MEA1672076.1 carbamoyltransferase HypF [Nitrospirillum sp. BR 11163]
MGTTGAMAGRHIRVRGLVQGVGFRPHVWRLAQALDIAGDVANDGDGVIIHAWGAPAALDRFQDRLRGEAPPLARIDAIEVAPHGGPPPGGFIIAASVAGTARTGIVPDAATCPACRAELFDPADRRRGYAFGNCTHCGPRLSIVSAIPYDRANTAMAAFPMCPACAAEYADPADRRFHAQPTACPACGPRLWLEPAPVAGTDPLDAAAALLRAGGIVAVKGIGGFHLVCDATSSTTVMELRRRKARDAKPFAVMARSVDEIGRYCRLDDATCALLQSPAAPIVLLARRPDGAPLPDGLAPGQDHLGVMLPYTPLHHLLMARMDGPLVMTSGNRSDEPQVISNEDARGRLAGLADAWLMHDRAILNRLDDSVVAATRGAPVILRRARGYAPAPLPLPPGFDGLPPTLAMGGELKATFCLLRDGQAILSQHIGDLENAAALDDYGAMLRLYRELFDFTPAVVAVDAHPDYLSTTLGAALARECGARLVRVGHHHAHMAACLADAGIGVGDGGEGAFGLILDGLGLGGDGTLWGGEILRGGYHGVTRAAHIAPAALAGGAAAMREPWRNLVAQLRLAFGDAWRTRAAPVRHHLPPDAQVAVLERMLETGTNTPPCSSAGRLFDAVAAALGIHPARIGHEAQAAMALEALARPHMAAARSYPVALGGGDPVVIGWLPMWEALLADLRVGEAPGLVAARFHLGFAEAMASAAARLGAGIGTIVALSGGVLQNRIILHELQARLRAVGCRPVTHARVPANDGGLALGQAVLAALGTSIPTPAACTSRPKAR